MEQLLQSVCRIHLKGIIHGDLKPGNILRVEEVYSVIDFDGSSIQGEVMPSKYSSAYAPIERLSSNNLKAQSVQRESWRSGFTEAEPSTARFFVWRRTLEK